jgi:hypothetical protein
VFFMLGVLAGACDCGSRAPTEVERRAALPPKPAILVGRVKLTDGASLPSYRLEDMERKVLDHTQRGKWPDACTPPKEADRQPVRLTSDGYLAGVMLATSEFSRPTTRLATTHEVVIRDCRLTPALVVAMRGDRLRIKNEVDFPFMPVYGPSAAVQTLTPGQTRDYDLKEMRVQPVLCGFTAPCGRTDVVVLSHPVYAVTDADGRFRIENFPPSETITINAWHPLFQEAHLELRVEPGETREIELTLAPAPEAAVPAAPAATPAAAP